MEPRLLPPGSGWRHAWFPAALIAIILLLIPGVVLFILHLCGVDNSVNTYLQDRFNISYHVLLPWWAGLALLLVPPLIFLLYFLKLKRRPLQVPSTFLWKKSIEDLHVNSLFQWLRENVLLLLQVLAVLALIFGVLAFQLHGRTADTKRYILMIDNSGSMSATDVSPTRLDAARELAGLEIDSHGDGDYGMVIVFNSSAQILQSYTNDRGLLKRTVAAIRQTDEPTRLDDALGLADSIANPNQPTDSDANPNVVNGAGVPTKVHLYSDGRFPDVSQFARDNLNFEYHMIGEPGAASVDNVGIVSFGARPDEGEPDRLEVFCGVANYRGQRVQAKVRLEVIRDGTILEVHDEKVDLEGRKTEDEGSAREGVKGGTTFYLKNASVPEGSVLHASLVDNHDQLRLDDEGWLVIGVLRKAKVLIVDSADPAGQDRVLRAYFSTARVRKVADVTWINTTDLKDETKYGRPARSGEYDLVIFDHKGPEKAEEMPQANTFFLDCVPPAWEKARLPKVEGPLVMVNRHPLLRDVLPLQEDVRLVETAPYQMTGPDAPPGAKRLFELRGDAAILFLDQSRQSFKDLVQTFPFYKDGQAQTNWFLNVKFPTFMDNVLHTLGNVRYGGSGETLQAGQARTFHLGPNVKEIDVRDPKGEHEKLTAGPRNEFTYGKTEKVGIYEVSWDGAVQQRFAVNLLDARESNIQPRSKFQLGEDTVASGEQRSQPRDLWKYAALAALGLLLIEWYIYNRRVYV